MLVRKAPLNTPTTSDVIVRVEFLAMSTGQSRETEAGDADVPAVPDETTTSSRPEVGVPGANGLVPPRLTVLPSSAIRYSPEVSVMLERVTFSKSNRAVMVLPLALRSGPARLTLDGATIPSGGPVSERPKNVPPDWASGPTLKVEPVSWIRGDDVVLES